MIVLNLAGLPIGIDNRYNHIVNLARDYYTDEEPLFTVSVTDEEIAEERRISGTNSSDAYYEAVVVYRHIAERLPEYGAAVFHGAVIEILGRAYAITAHSGVGKSTHVSILKRNYKDIEILNGDKPIIRLVDGIPYVFGTPWQGKEDLGHNSKAPLAAIAFIKRGETNATYEISPSSAVMDFMSQIYLPRKDKSKLSGTILLADKILRSVRLFGLECNMEDEAAHVSYKAFVSGAYTK